MEFIKENKYYIIFGIIFIIGIILIIVGGNARRKIANNDDALCYIDLVGNNEITIYKDEEYVEPGYRGYDGNNVDLTNKVEVVNNIKTDYIGTYKVIYSLKNIVKERVVKVVNKEPGATTIHLYGDVNTFLYVGDEYVEKGYEVIDTIDGLSLRDKVKVSNNVDTSKVGVYKVTYTVINSSGITTTAVRTVIVMDSEMSLSVDNNNYTNGNVKINIYINDDLFDYLILPNGDKIKEKIYTYEVNENGSYKFVMYNRKGKNIEKSIDINIINRTNPSGSCSGSYKDGKSVINISANDDIGISRYEMEGISYTNNQITIDEEISKANITIYDKAGNSTNISCNLEDKNVYGDIKNISSEYPPKYIIEGMPNVSLNYYYSSNKKGFSYWVYLPDNLKPNMPMIMYMPGYDGLGDDYANESKRDIGGGPMNEIVYHGYSYDAIIVHMQVPSYDKVYGYLGSYMELLDKIADEFKVNKKKISLMGFSHGCYGVMNLIPSYQTYFSAVVPIGCKPSCPECFVSTPTWTFVGSGDGDGTMQPFVNQINYMGGNAKHTTTAYKAHEIVHDNYSILRDPNYNVIEWMTSQTRK